MIQLLLFVVQFCCSLCQSGIDGELADPRWSEKCRMHAASLLSRVFRNTPVDLLKLYQIDCLSSLYFQERQDDFGKTRRLDCWNTPMELLSVLGAISARLLQIHVSAERCMQKFYRLLFAHTDIDVACVGGSFLPLSYGHRAFSVNDSGCVSQVCGEHILSFYRAALLLAGANS